MIGIARRMIGLVIMVTIASPLRGDQEQSSPRRPNVLWIYLEDVSRWFGCYGDSLAHTPNIDALACSGVMFRCA